METFHIQVIHRVVASSEKEALDLLDRNLAKGGPISILAVNVIPEKTP